MCFEIPGIKQNLFFLFFFKPVHFIVLSPILTVYLLVFLQLVLDLCKDPRLLSPPVVQWQRGET